MLFSNKIYIFESQNKIKLFILFVIYIILTFKSFSSIYYEMIYPNNNIQVKNSNLNLNETMSTEKNETIKTNNNGTKQNFKCIKSNNKLIWKNQTDIGLESSIEEIKNSESLKISFENREDFYKRNNPKISLIITVYNQGYYIKELYSHILQQELKDIEIVFVNDASTDNSSSIIKELMNDDKRIIYLQNKINKKQYYSIARGILQSHGEYIISIDPDDFLLNNILIKAYQTATNNDLDILQYYMLLKINEFRVFKGKYKSGIMCNNKDIRDIYYYGSTRNLPDKLIKRNIYINSINFMKKELFDADYHIHTDDTFFFGIIHFANSYGFLEQIGYYYNNNPDRNKKYKFKEDQVKIINRDIKSLFNIMKYFIIQSDNDILEKNYIAYKFFYGKVYNIIRKKLKYVTNDFDFYIDVLNLYVNCSFFNNDKKNIIRKFIRKLEIRKKKYYTLYEYSI